MIGVRGFVLAFSLLRLIVQVRSDPKLTLMRELSSDLLSVCAVTAHVKDGPRLERAVESAAKGGLPAHSSAMIAAQVATVIFTHAALDVCCPWFNFPIWFCVLT